MRDNLQLKLDDLQLKLIFNLLRETNKINSPEQYTYLTEKALEIIYKRTEHHTIECELCYDLIRFMKFIDTKTDCTETAYRALYQKCLEYIKKPRSDFTKYSKLAALEHFKNTVPFKNTVLLPKPKL